jgi:hypothetical protein
VTLADGLLLMEDEDAMRTEYNDAVTRYAKHLDREVARRKAGLPTDLERYLAGEEIHDTE